jgi:DNA-binding transcriptional LysR family regulator
MENLSGVMMFVQVADSLSFAATARALGVSPSAVSKSISRLEARVGVRVFQRSTRSIQLTTEGQVFLERCHRVLRELEAAEAELSSMSKLAVGRLRVGLPFAGGLALPLIADFMGQHPQIELSVSFSDRTADVIDEGLDVVVRGGQQPDSRLKARRLGASKMVIVASPTYLDQRGMPSSPEDLMAHTCLIYRSSSSGKITAWPLRRTSSSAGRLDLPQTLVADSLDALRYAALQGRGIACLPEFSVTDRLKTGELVAVLDGYTSETITFQVVWPSSKQMSPKVRAFVDFVTSRFPSLLKTTSH